MECEPQISCSGHGRCLEGTIPPGGMQCACDFYWLGQRCAIPWQETSAVEPLWVPFRIVVGATHLAVVVTTLFHIVTRCIARRRAAEGKARAVQRGVKGSAMLGARRSTHPPVRGLSGAGSAASEVHHSQSLLAHDSLGERARSTRPRPIPAGKGRGSSSEASTSASPQMALSIESAASASPFSGRADRSVSRSGRTRRAPTPVTPTESQYDGDASDAETASIQGTPAIAGSRARKRPMAFSDIVSVFCCAGSCLRLVWLVDPFGTLGIFGQTLVDVFLLRTPQVCFLLALLVVIGMWYRVLNAVAPNPKELRRVNTLLWCTAAVMVCLAVVPSSLAAFGIGLPLTLALTNVSLALFVVIMTLYGAMHALRLSGELSAAARRTNAMLEQQSTGAGSLAATDATAKLLQQQVRFNEARLSIVVTMRIFVFLGATMCAFVTVARIMGWSPHHLSVDFFAFVWTTHIYEFLLALSLMHATSPGSWRLFRNFRRLVREAKSSSSTLRANGSGADPSVAERGDGAGVAGARGSGRYGTHGIMPSTSVPIGSPVVSPSQLTAGMREHSVRSQRAAADEFVTDGSEGP